MWFCGKLFIFLSSHISACIDCAGYYRLVEEVMLLVMYGSKLMIFIIII